jgi:hypothetical protein
MHAHVHKKAYFHSATALIFSSSWFSGHEELDSITVVGSPEKVVSTRYRRNGILCARLNGVDWRFGGRGRILG